MEKNYPINKPKISHDGPSDLTVKRILAFSKAFKSFNTSEDVTKAKEPSNN
jgi:hypothetical protein